MTTHLLDPDHAKPAPVAFPIHPLLQARWSPRAFSDEELTADEMNLLFEAARWTASASNEQPWSFVVATRRQSKRFEELLDCLNPGNQVWAKRAAGLAIAVVRQQLSSKPSLNRTAQYDLGQAVANFTFQATALGLAVHQMAGLDLAKIRTVCRIPEGFDPVTAVAFGRPGDPAALDEAVRAKDATPRKRKPLSEFVFGGAWECPVSW
jgi:nitroreductase